MAVEVARDGVYEFAVRRWPEELNRPISEIVGAHEEEPDYEVLTATDARLKVADFDQTKPVSPEATNVKFKVRLKAGKTRVQAWFVKKNVKLKTQSEKRWSRFAGFFKQKRPHVKRGAK